MVTKEFPMDRNPQRGRGEGEPDSHIQYSVLNPLVTSNISSKQ